MKAYSNARAAAMALMATIVAAPGFAPPRPRVTPGFAQPAKPKDPIRSGPLQALGLGPIIGYRSRSKYDPRQGARECARRRGEIGWQARGRA